MCADVVCSKKYAKSEKIGFSSTPQSSMACTISRHVRGESRRVSMIIKRSTSIKLKALKRAARAFGNRITYSDIIARLVDAEFARLAPAAAPAQDAAEVRSED